MISQRLFFAIRDNALQAVFELGIFPLRAKEVVAELVRNGGSVNLGGVDETLTRCSVSAR